MPAFRMPKSMRLPRRVTAVCLIALGLAGTGSTLVASVASAQAVVKREPPTNPWCRSPFCT
jgi:hypothetical protein